MRRQRRPDGFCGSNRVSMACFLRFLRSARHASFRSAISIINHRIYQKSTKSTVPISPQMNQLSPPKDCCGEILTSQPVPSQDRRSVKQWAKAARSLEHLTDSAAWRWAMRAAHAGPHMDPRDPMKSWRNGGSNNQLIMNLVAMNLAFSH